MSNCKRERRRIILKTTDVSGTDATVPTSEDHSDGSWLSTDIYRGEQMFNTADNILYNRGENGIGSVFMPYGFMKGILNQSSQNAPVLNSYVSTLGFPTMARSSTGTYTLTKTGAFPENRTLITHGSLKSTAYRVNMYRTDDNTITITTLNGNNLTDAILAEFSFSIEILPSTPVS